MYNYSSTYLKHTVCSMSSYELSHREYAAFSFGRDYHIPSKTDYNLVCIKFKAHCQSIRHKLTSITQTKLPYLKTKLSSAYKKYNAIKVPYKDWEVINRLSIYPHIILLVRQEKARGIVIIVKGKYI